MKSLTQKKIINCDTNEEYDSDDNVDDSEEMRKKEVCLYFFQIFIK